MSSSINSDVDAVTEGINRVGIIDSKVQICANCGKEGSDVTNTCNKCKLVMYCNAACKKKHRHKHKRECEEHLLRAAEKHDEKLFKQPPQLLEDCPICYLRLPTLETGQTLMNCCGKLICCGCVHAFQSRAVKAGRLKEDDVCPFCRTSSPKSDKELMKRLEKRIELNDALNLCNMGDCCAKGLHGLHQNRAKALELWHRAGELGHATAYNNIGMAYKDGRGVEVDMKKATYYFELAAMGGNAEARLNLGCIEAQAGKMDRALRHYMIAVKDGNGSTLKSIQEYYKEGHASKDEFAKALRSYQAYLDEIKSDQRDQAAKIRQKYKYYESAV